MSSDQLAAWLALYFTPRIGPKNFARLLERDSPINIVQSNTEALLALGLNQPQIDYLKTEAMKDAEQCLEWRQLRQDNQIITKQDSSYPALLEQAKGSPPILFVQGEVSGLSQPQIAIVGSRSASNDGLNSARNFAKALVEQGVHITSGLALGVDGYAHDGALQAGGVTLAVLGCGLQTVYPARHRDLAERIVAAKGALISEFHPKAKPKADHFPRRNRIISGLSLGVLVVEAAEKSGSLITARYAAEQGREVFAIPGPIHDLNSRGCNRLIQQGAGLVMSVEDIIDEIDTLLRWSNTNKSPIQQELFTQSESKEELPFPQLLANVGTTALPVDILADRTNIPVQEVMTQLLELELLGHVIAVSGGYIRNRRG